MYCGNCGTERSEAHARFCRRCGASFEQGVAESDASATFYAPSPTYPAPTAPARQAYPPANPGVWPGSQTRPTTPETVRPRFAVLGLAGTLVFAVGIVVGYLAITWILMPA